MAGLKAVCVCVCARFQEQNVENKDDLLHLELHHNFKTIAAEIFMADSGLFCHLEDI